MNIFKRFLNRIGLKKDEVLVLKLYLKNPSDEFYKKLETTFGYSREKRCFVETIPVDVRINTIGKTITITKE